MGVKPGEGWDVQLNLEIPPRSQKHMKMQNNQSRAFCRGWNREDDVTIEIPGPGAYIISSVRRNPTTKQDGRCVEKHSDRH